MKRKECLDLANEIVHADRATKYGAPEDNFGDIAAFWTTYLRKKLRPDSQISTADVAIMSAMIKVSRIMNTPDHEDSWVDIAGYAACGVQCATGTELFEAPNSHLKADEAELESFPVLMICGCPLSLSNLVARGANLCCAKCGYQYPRPEKKERVNLMGHEEW